LNILPWDESARLHALNSYAILDTAPEAVYDEVTRMVALMFDAPMSAVTLVDEARQWFKSQVGLGVSETPIATSFCKIGILQGGSLTVPDTLHDAQFACNPLVTGQPGIRFYAGEALATSDGYPIGMLCVLDDKPRPQGITEQQRLMLKTLAGLVMGQMELRRTLHRQQLAEAALRTERAEIVRLNTVLHNTVLVRTGERDQIWQATRDLMVLIDRDGRFVRANPAWDRLFGATGYDGALFRDVIHADDQQGYADHFQQLANDVGSAAFEARVRTPAGDYMVMHWQLAPLGDGYFASGRDLTAQRAMEEQLRQSQKMEAIGQLTGGIAHDFNNLLQGISGALEVMGLHVAGGRYDGLARFINTAQGATGRAGALTHRLLAFSRRHPLSSGPADVNPLIVSMEELLRRTLGEQVTLAVDLADGVWPVAADGNQLENAILNLCINARDAMPAGGRLTVQTRNACFLDEQRAGVQGLLPGEYVYITVVDTGSGMSAETLSRAFEPFYTTKAIGQGTGLGLSMVYGFSQQSRGNVTISSQPGYGTRVGLYLPRHADDAQAGLVGAAATAATGGPRHGMILVVEDDTLVRTIVVEHLAELGYTVLQADDGAAGLALVQSGLPIDVLLTDIGLPGMTGRALAQAARAASASLKLLYMTGYDASAPQADASTLDGEAVLIKPFALTALAQRIGQLLDRNGG
jgi:PAS domain S-box-containing protein